MNYSLFDISKIPEIKTQESGIAIGVGRNISINYRYDFIQLETSDLKKRIEEFPITPTGVIFDVTNDDIIVFDIYKLRRFQYRLNRSKFQSDKQDIDKLLDLRNNKNSDTHSNNNHFNPRNIEILSEFEKKKIIIHTTSNLC